MKSHRLTDEELKKIQEEHAKKEARLSELRKERAIKMKEEMKQRELEEATPKARSALAARWEEQVKSRSGGGKLTTSQNKTTVMSDVSLVEILQCIYMQNHNMEACLTSLVGVIGHVIPTFVILRSIVMTVLKAS